MLLQPVADSFFELDLYHRPVLGRVSFLSRIRTTPMGMVQKQRLCNHLLRRMNASEDTCVVLAGG